MASASSKPAVVLTALPVGQRTTDDSPTLTARVHRTKSRFSTSSLIGSARHASTKSGPALHAARAVHAYAALEAPVLGLQVSDKRVIRARDEGAGPLPFEAAAAEGYAHACSLAGSGLPIFQQSSQHSSAAVTGARQ